MSKKNKKQLKKLLKEKKRAGEGMVTIEFMQDAVATLRELMSAKYDLTKHPNYQYTAGCNKKYTFDIEKFLDHRLKLKPNDEYEVIEME